MSPLRATALHTGQSITISEEFWLIVCYAEDIDFEFVYALHNFVATVEGQANAAKGDTMVLLDDSNTYWWLVRIVKDGSIGTSIWHNRRGKKPLTLHRISSSGTHRNAH